MPVFPGTLKTVFHSTLALSGSSLLVHCSTMNLKKNNLFFVSCHMAQSHVVYGVIVHNVYDKGT